MRINDWKRQAEGTAKKPREKLCGRIVSFRSDFDAGNGATIGIETDSSIADVSLDQHSVDVLRDLLG